MIDTYDDDSEYERPNKSKMKRDAQALLDLTKKMIELPESKWQELSLPEDVVAELCLLKETPQHIAKKRQMKRVAKLLRDVDVSIAQEILEKASCERVEINVIFHRAERWRERLLAQGASALTEFLDQNPKANIQSLNQLIRNAKNELIKGKTTKSSKLLFKLIRDTLA